MLGSFSELLAQLKKRFLRKEKNRTPSQEDRNFVLAACQTWFSEYSKQVQLLGVPAEMVVKLNELFGNLLRTVGTAKRRIAYLENIQSIEEIFEGFYAEAQVVEWQHNRPNGFPTEQNPDEVVELLASVDSDLATRYRQVISDLSDPNRMSYAGTAGELREILRIVMLTNAPDDQVKQKRWFKQTRASATNQKEKERGPTHAERVRYILETKREVSDKDVTIAQSNEEAIDTILGKAARSSYDGMNSQLHGSKNKGDIIRSLQYVRPLLIDLLSAEMEPGGSSRERGS